MPQLRMVGLLDDFRAQQKHARETINNWPAYKRMSIVRHGRIVPWVQKDRMESTELLYFTALWCGPCKAFGPRIKQVAADLGITLVKIDADEHQDMIEEFGVMSIPTVIVMRNGTQADRFVGAKTEDQLRKSLASYAA